MSGEKTIETRSYPISPNYLHVDLALIETPGPRGKFKARIVGLIRFSGCFEYGSEDAFYADVARHRVSKDLTAWRWRADRPKFGWVIERFSPLNPYVAAPAGKGQVYSTNICLESLSFSENCR